MSFVEKKLVRQDDLAFTVSVSYEEAMEIIHVYNYPLDTTNASGGGTIVLPDDVKTGRLRLVVATSVSDSVVSAKLTTPTEEICSTSVTGNGSQEVSCDLTGYAGQEVLVMFSVDTASATAGATGDIHVYLWVVRGG